MAVTQTPRISQTRWSSGQDLVKREDFDSDAASLEANVTVFREGPFADRPAAGVVGRFYTVKNDTVKPEYNGRQYYDNGTEWKVVSYTNDQLAESTVSSTTPLTVRGQTTQTADLLRVEDGAGVPQLRVTADGYTSNQESVGSTSGVRLGWKNTHASAAQIVSVGANSPVVTVRGATDQVGNLLDLRDSLGTTVAYVGSAGGANFSGTVAAKSVSSTTSVTADTLSVATSANLNTTDIVAKTENDVALQVRSHGSIQNANLVEYYSATSAQSARILQDGTMTTDGRLMVGNNTASSGEQSFPGNAPVVQFQNNRGASNPVLSLYARTAGQTGKMFQIYNSNSVQNYWVDEAGNQYSAANIGSTTATVGSGGTAPTPYYNSVTPRLEVITGSGTGSYDETIAIRHSGKSTSAVERKVGIRMTLGNETSQAESDKWAGVYARSVESDAKNVHLAFWAGGKQVGAISPNGNFWAGNSLFTRDYLEFNNIVGEKIHLGKASDVLNTIGTQFGWTTYVRANNFAVYAGGEWHPDGLNPGGGTTLLEVSQARTKVRRLTVTQPSEWNSKSPMVQIGDVNDHMSLTVGDISVWGDMDHNQEAELRLNQNSGDIKIGGDNSVVSFRSRALTMGNTDNSGANTLLFKPSAWGSFSSQVGRSPRVGDWHFDESDQAIKLYTPSGWKQVKLT